MEVSDAIRQVEELLTLQENLEDDSHVSSMISGATIEIKTPQLFQRLQRIGPNSKGKLELKKKLAFDIHWNNNQKDCFECHLSFEFPLDYPSSSTCIVQLNNTNNDCNFEEQLTSGSTKIQNYLKPFVGCECVELVLEWVKDNKHSCFFHTNNNNDKSLLKNDTTTTTMKDNKVCCYVLRYNHLLFGPEHKKEKAMVDVAKKSKLYGAIVWGTPGIVLLLSSTEQDVKLYATDCRDIGKRPTDGIHQIWLPKTGIIQAGLQLPVEHKEQQQQTTSRGGLEHFDTKQLRIACGSNENLVRQVLGLG